MNVDYYVALHSLIFLPSRVNGMVINAPGVVGTSQKRPPKKIKVQYSNVPGKPVDLQTLGIDPGKNVLNFTSAVITRFFRLELEELDTERPGSDTFLNG